MKHLLEALKRQVGDFYEKVTELAVTPSVSPQEIREHLVTHYAFDDPVSAEELIDDVATLLGKWTLHVTHPRYFGLFNPSVRPVTVAADTLVALYNPQLAVWLHAPAANEIERHVLRFLLARLGFDPDAAVGHFTSGGQEANLTSVIEALSHRFAQVGDTGLRALPGQPVLYLSEESHHSFHKIAQATGLGREAVHIIPTDEALRMDLDALDRAVISDRHEGLLPFMVIGTAGTTSAGIVDSLAEIAELSRRYRLWFHVDAAWGGTAVLSERLRPYVKGIERADSVTWDAHKWLSVPLGAGMFFCRWPDAVSSAFRVSASNYVHGHHRRHILLGRRPGRNPGNDSRHTAHRFSGFPLAPGQGKVHHRAGLRALSPT